MTLAPHFLNVFSFGTFDDWRVKLTGLCDLERPTPYSITYHRGGDAVQVQFTNKHSGAGSRRHLASLDMQAVLRTHSKVVENILMVI